MLQSMYQAVSSRLARVPFAQIWPGFSPGAFALYQGQLACIAGALQPRPQSFLGNTALPWQGGYLAIWELEGDQLILDTLGEHVAANFIAGKKKEWDEYRTRVSSWEREKYIINY